MINLIATNTTGSYCLSVSQKVTCAISHHLYYTVSSKCLPSARTQARRLDADDTHQWHIQ